MPRQTFLTKETFINTTDDRLKQVLLSLPEVMPEMRLIGENKVIEQIRFSYEVNEKRNYIIDVSVLAVNDQFTRLSLHASHKDGKAFITDPEMHLMLHQMEAAVQATIRGEVYYAMEDTSKTKTSQKTSWFNPVRTGLMFLFMKKKFS